MISAKLEQTDPEGTGYCVGGRLSIADLLVRALPGFVLWGSLLVRALTGDLGVLCFVVGLPSI